MSTSLLLHAEAAELGCRLGLIGRHGAHGARTRARAWAIHIVVLAVFGVALPLSKGLDFFDPLILGAYTCLGAVFACPAAASAFAAQAFAKPSLAAPGSAAPGRLAEHLLASAHARIAVCVAYGETMVLGMTALGVATVYFSHLNGLFFPPAIDSLLEAAGFGFLLTAALSTMAVWLTLRYSPGIAKVSLRAVFLALLAWFFLRGRAVFLGFVWQNSGFALAAGIVFWIALRSTTRPESG